MTTKQHGRADVTIVALVENRAAVDWLLNRFGRVARSSGTLVISEPLIEEVMSPADWVDDADVEGTSRCIRVSFRYFHTARNQYNHDHDARRFFERAISDEKYWGRIVDTHLNEWTPS